MYDAVIPGWVPGPARFWTYASGVAELAVAGLLAARRTRRTRRVGGWAAAALFLAVYPANVQMTVDAASRCREAPGDRRRLLVLVATLARLPLQWPLVASAAAVARGHDDRRA